MPRFKVRKAGWAGFAVWDTEMDKQAAYVDGLKETTARHCDVLNKLDRNEREKQQRDKEVVRA